MSKNKEFIQEEDYRLIAFPKCVCTYRGANRGSGTNRYGTQADGIEMSNPEDWEHLEKTISIEQQIELDTALGAVGIRQFESGANRNSDEGKLDFEGFLSPTVLKVYAEYMHKNRFLENGQMRDSDNWQKGIPVPAYMKSMYRHFFDTWSNYRGIETPETQIQNLCGMMFNTMGMLHELLKEEN